MFWYVFLVAAVAIVAVFTFVSIETWSKNRLKEREEFYKNETLQKMLDGSPESAETVRQVMREEEERLELRERRSMKQGLVLGGLITAVVGLGLGVFLFYIADNAAFLVGLIPFLIGVVLVTYGALMSVHEKASG